MLRFNVKKVTENIADIQVKELMTLLFMRLSLKPCRQS